MAVTSLAPKSKDTSDGNAHHHRTHPEMRTSRTFAKRPACVSALAVLSVVLVNWLVTCTGNTFNTGTLRISRLKDGRKARESHARAQYAQCGSQYYGDS